MQNKNVYYTTDKYNDLKDEEIIVEIQNGNEQALTYLLNKYKPLVNNKVGKYFIIGAEKEDIVQEGMIGLYKAIKSFDVEKQNKFKTFANICIERQLITAIKTSTRQKHMPLNSCISLNTSAYSNEDDGVELLETYNNKTMEDPLETMMKNEYYKEIKQSITSSLSKFERQVLDRLILGESYEVIAKRFDTPVKSIDNAIQRIRKKANKYTDEQIKKLIHDGKYIPGIFVELNNSKEVLRYFVYGKKWRKRLIKNFNYVYDNSYGEILKKACDNQNVCFHQLAHLTL